MDKFLKVILQCINTREQRIKEEIKKLKKLSLPVLRERYKVYMAQANSYAMQREATSSPMQYNTSSQSYSDNRKMATAVQEEIEKRIKKN